MGHIGSQPESDETEHPSYQSVLFSITRADDLFGRTYVVFLEIFPCIGAWDVVDCMGY